MNLDLQSIREAAMNPPAGTARDYERMLAEQFEQANADEARLRREGMEAAMRRALDRSGAYNVGSMLVPQDFGELALGAAMGPGLGTGLRTALAALGGLTTQIGDAEGAFLPRYMVQRLLGSQDSRARQFGEAGLEALESAGRTPGGRDWTRARTEQRRNDTFMDALYDTREFDVLPTEAGLAWALPASRPREYAGLFDMADIVQNIGRGVRDRRTRLMSDPILEEALPQSSRLNAGIVAVGRPQGTTLGSYNPDTGLVQVNAGRPAVMRDTYDHEMQHWIQNETPGRYARGTSPERVADVNPNLWAEYLNRLEMTAEPPAGWGSVLGGFTSGNLARDASRQLYERNFGEWEARLAAEYNRLADGAPEGINPLGFVLDDFTTRNAWPDFRIR